jgi:hypothetical protein
LEEGREGVVEVLPGLEAVVELTEEAVQQVPLCGSVPVAVVASASVVRVRAGRSGEGGEGPKKAGVDEAVVLDEASADEALFAGGSGDGC